MTDANGNMVMPVAPYYGGNGNDGMFGGNGGWMWKLKGLHKGGIGNERTEESEAGRSGRAGEA